MVCVYVIDDCCDVGGVMVMVVGVVVVVVVGVVDVVCGVGVAVVVVVVGGVIVVAGVGCSDVAAIVTVGFAVVCFVVIDDDVVVVDVCYCCWC